MCPSNSRCWNLISEAILLEVGAPGRRLPYDTNVLTEGLKRTEDVAQKYKHFPTKCRTPGLNPGPEKSAQKKRLGLFFDHFTLFPFCPMRTWHWRSHVAEAAGSQPNSACPHLDLGLSKLWDQDFCYSPITQSLEFWRSHWNKLRHYPRRFFFLCFWVLFFCHTARNFS